MRTLKLLIVSFYSVVLVCAVVPNLVGGDRAAASAPEDIPAPDVQAACPDAEEHELPLPSTLPPGEFVRFEQKVLEFLQSSKYVRLGWCRDKGVRDTGPFLKKVYYGTHPAVRIFYSPKMMGWLVGGRQGPVPDGAMIIKEQYPPPAARYEGMGDDQLPKVTDWTVMIKDSAGSKDGWFWGEWYNGMSFDDDQPPFNYPTAGFGLYCLRCHSTSEGEHTFASLNNVKGFPGEPLTFEDDGSWRGTAPPTVIHFPRPSGPISAPPTTPNPDFLKLFDSIPGVPLEDVQKLPWETYDRVVAPSGTPRQFVGSTLCMSCHGALNNKGPFGPVMFLPSHPQPSDPSQVAGANVSPYGSWRWSPMGLAGRDPVFYAQLESELAYLGTLPPPQNETLSSTVRNTCFSCHGVMGKRQLDDESQGGVGDFKLDYVQLTDRSDPNFKYGALARDGISCAVCHRVTTDNSSLPDFLNNATSGKFLVGEPDQIFGPYPDDQIVPYAMQNATGIKPQYNPYIKSSRLCGSCHTINLPVLDGKLGVHSIEQSTYLEWLNSQYQNEFATPGAAVKSCQDCHMPGSYHSEEKGISVDQLNEKMAVIEDETYPIAENRVPVEQITVRKRDNFRRHEFLGLNVFLLEMFDQFWDVLGVSKSDYMSGSSTGLQDAIDGYAQQAQERTAQIAVSARPAGPRRIVADVAVTNLAGHRFPSGVGFRRLFVELSVIDDENGNVVWASGRTNELGAIVDGEGNILPSEFFTEYTDPQGQVRQYYQPHYQIIDAQDQVQIYEELVQNAEGKFTTSFIRRDATVKDNRLLAIGWTKNGPDPSLSGIYLKATQPDGEAVDDPDYQDGKAGTDRLTYLIRLPEGVIARRCTVRATLYYQSIPPYYLDDRFRDVPGGAATKRLYYLTSNLNLAGTPVENWKLKVVSADAPVRRRVPRGETPRRTPQAQSPTGGTARTAPAQGLSRTRPG